MRSRTMTQRATTRGRLVGVGILSLVLCTFTSRTPMGPLLTIHDHDKVPKPSKRMFPNAKLTIPMEREEDGARRELVRRSLCNPAVIPARFDLFLCQVSHEITKPHYLRFFEAQGFQNALAPPSIPDPAAFFQTPETST